MSKISWEPIPPLLSDPYVVQKKPMGFLEAHVFGLQIFLMYFKLTHSLENFLAQKNIIKKN